MKKTDKNNDAKTDASYPLYDLSEAVKVAEAIRDLGGGNAPVSRSLLAQHLKYAENGPSFFQRVSAAKAFGIIDGRGSYSLTELARQYFYPTVENGKQVASVKMLTTPKAFSILVQKFDGGKPPSIDMIGNIIHAEASIPVSKKNILAGCFMRSAQYLGVIDASGYLRCKAFAASSGQRNPQHVPQNAASTPLSNPPPNVPEVFDGLEEHSFYLDRDKTKKVTLSCYLILTQAEYTRICNWIKATWIVEDGKKLEEESIPGPEMAA